MSNENYEPSQELLEFIGKWASEAKAGDEKVIADSEMVLYVIKLQDNNIFVQVSEALNAAAVQHAQMMAVQTALASMLDGLTPDGNTSIN